MIRLVQVSDLPLQQFILLVATSIFDYCNTTFCNKIIKEKNAWASGIIVKEFYQ